MSVCSGNQGNHGNWVGSWQGSGHQQHIKGREGERTATAFSTTGGDVRYPGRAMPRASQPHASDISNFTPRLATEPPGAPAILAPRRPLTCDGLGPPRLRHHVHRHAHAARHRQRAAVLRVQRQQHARRHGGRQQVQQVVVLARQRGLEVQAGEQHGQQAGEGDAWGWGEGAWGEQEEGAC